MHGDDFTVAGPVKALKLLKQKMADKYEIKLQMLGRETDMEREISVLNRIVRWKRHGIEYEPDQRHAELITRQMGVENGKSVVTPIIAESIEQARARRWSPELSPEEASKYRAITARMNYLAQDRSDLQFAANAACKYMSSPRQQDWSILKRAARYLSGAPRATQTFVWQTMPKHIVTHTDSDWAGDKETRKSTSGGTMSLGSHTIKTWSTSQHCVALSSGEAELYALVRGAAQSKGLMSMLKDFGMNVCTTVCTDATAAIGIAHRQGLGKVRHLDVQYLWVQSEVAEGRLRVEKIPTRDNPADIFTKPVPKDCMDRHLTELGLALSTTRASRAPTLQQVNLRVASTEASARQGEVSGYTRCTASSI